MIKVFNKESNEWIGNISDRDLQFLQDHLEEESSSDQDYYITVETWENFKNQGVSPSLLEVLRLALLQKNAVEIRWQKA